MIYIIFSVLISALMGIASYLGYKYAQMKKERDEAVESLAVEAHKTAFMRMAVSANEDLHNEFKEIERAKTPEDFTRLYNKHL